MKTNLHARDVAELDDGEEVTKPDNTSSVFSPSLNTINYEGVHEFIDEAVRLLNAHLIPAVNDNWVPGN